MPINCSLSELECQYQIGVKELSASCSEKKGKETDDV